MQGHAGSCEDSRTFQHSTRSIMIHVVVRHKIRLVTGKFYRRRGDSSQVRSPAVSHHTVFSGTEDIYKDQRTLVYSF